ncbi:hypothetical protein HDV02_002606 [Globomyces sp. JEL0801]|nr:hypothetical protein HDV02_002606 [Globomyces sp. JEL0801]
MLHSILRFQRTSIQTIGKRKIIGPHSNALYSTFQNDDKIPKLPVPSLENLKEKYLNVLKPIIKETNLNQYLKTEEVVNEFLADDGFGQVLQNRLIEYDNKQKDSWLEHFWLQKAYLEWREPSLINVNWWCQIKDHPEQPEELLAKPSPKGVLTAFQIKRAAGLITNLLNFNDMLNNQTFPPEYQKKTPMCMSQYQKIFGTTRIPGPKTDTLKYQYPTTAKHIIVLIRNQIYKVNVLTNNGGRVTLEELERILLAVGKQSSIELGKSNPLVGVLTAGDRDTWADAYNELSKHPENVSNFEIINDALFAVCLDDYSTLKNIDVCHLQLFHNFDATNRWFDKSLQLIVASSGRAGFNGEHTPTDAVVPGTVMNYICENEPAVDPENAVQEHLPAPAKLNWHVEKPVGDYIKKSAATAKALIEDTESCLLQTDVYGSRYMKEVAQCSPDAYIQLALQLAYYRIHSAPVSVYESASIRLFRKGRTETGRSMSSESLAFLKSFDNDDVLYLILPKRVGYMRDASTGKGIDRHMLGLRCMIEDGEMSKATMFTDKSYMDSLNFQLSTSNMSPGTNFYGGFGPVVPDGYGINYAIGKDKLKFSISAKRSSSHTKIFKLRKALEQVLLDFRILFPKPSEVWGIGWAKKHQIEKLEQRQLEKMKILSDELKANQEKIASRRKQDS